MAQTSDAIQFTCFEIPKKTCSQHYSGGEMETHSNLLVENKSNTKEVFSIANKLL